MMKHQEESLVADLIKQVEIKHKLLKIKAKFRVNSKKARHHDGAFFITTPKCLKNDPKMLKSTNDKLQLVHFQALKSVKSSPDGNRTHI